MLDRLVTRRLNPGVRIKAFGPSGLRLFHNEKSGMKQNIYDKPEFFAKYCSMPRSTGGLDRAEEWPNFRPLLPDLRDTRVLDLGCGLGWHCRYARQQGASSVVGVDLSERMLARAKALTDNPGIEYRWSAIEDIDFRAGAFSVVISSLALHYIRDFDVVSQRVHHWLAAGGAFVFSVEHPMVTALAAQQWCFGPNGERLHWPVDKYQEEGPRHTQWLADDVIKYHRTVASYVNTLIESGFRITKLIEPMPSLETLIGQPGLEDERRRPSLLFIAASRDPIP